MLQFDAETARFLDDAYQGSAVSRRRRANFDALDLRPGDRVADIGCGTGLLTLEIARAVGNEGRVWGIDPSPDMRKAAAERCAGREAVTIVDGGADALPLEDASLDRAVAVQVFEYFDDIPRALREVARVLRPGGLLVIGDIHWGTLIWHSDNPNRMARMIAAFDRHLADRTVPQTLTHTMRSNGFKPLSVTPVAFAETTLVPDGIARMMMLLARDYVLGNALLPEAEVRAWEREQHDLDKAGRFFQSLVHYVTVGRRT